MQIPGGDLHAENEAVFLTRGMHALGKAFLMLPFMEKSALRIGFGTRHFPCWRRGIVRWVVKRLLAMSFPILIDSFPKPALVFSGGLRDRLPDSLLQVGVGLDVRRVNEHRFRREAAPLLSGRQNPAQS